jgi:hypothetical protein
LNMVPKLLKHDSLPRADVIMARRVEPLGARGTGAV